MAGRSVLPPVVRARFLFAGSIPRSAFFCFFCLWAVRSLCVLRAGSGRVVCASVPSFPVFLAVGSIPGPVVFCFSPPGLALLAPPARRVWPSGWYVRLLLWEGVLPVALLWALPSTVLPYREAM